MGDTGIPKPMHICIIGDTGGVHVRNRAVAFSKMGHRIDTLTQRPSGIAELNEVFPARSHSQKSGMSSGPHGLTYMYDYYRLAKKCSGQIVHIHYPCSLGAWLWLLSGSSKPLLVSVMGGDILFDEQGNQPATVRWMTRQVIKRADYVTAKSQYLLTTLRNFGLPDERVEKVIWGVDQTLFKPSPSDLLKQKFGLGPSEKVIFSPRILRRLYNIHIIVEALPAVIRACPDTRLLIAEYEADDTYRQELIKRISELDLTEHVTFCGSIPFDEMCAHYNLADVIIGIPGSDGFPQTMLEGMSCGIPNVVSKLDRYKELVTDGESALFVDINPLSLSEGIIDVFKNPDKAKRIGKAGRELVAERASFQSSVMRVEKIYQELADHSRARQTPFLTRCGFAIILMGLAIRNSIFHVLRIGPSTDTENRA